MKASKKLNLFIWLLLGIGNPLTVSAETNFVDAKNPAAQKIASDAFMAAVKKFKSNARTPQQHLIEHKLDTQACKSAFALLKDDAEFKDGLFTASSLEFPSWIEAMKGSQYSRNSHVQYLIKNSTRFQIDRDFHATGMAANIEELYCQPEIAIRLLKIEFFGETQQAWLIQKEILDIFLSNLAYPYIEGTDGYYEFEILYSAVLKAKSIYRFKQRSAFLKWLTEAATTIHENTKNTLEGAAGMTVAEQKQIIASWIQKLTAMSKQ